MLTPPSKTIVIISNSNPRPISPRTVPSLAAYRIPAMAEMIPEKMNSNIFTRATLIPEYKATF